MKVLFINAHFDDFEFTAAGTFLAWRKKLGDALQARVIICTDGRAGHQFRTREETGRMRLQEQAASARIGGYDFEVLTLPNGEVPREACLQSTPSLLAALWKSIRDFEPDYLFAPPVVVDPLAGIHVDHVAVADAVRRVAYMINVPHAFTPEYPADETSSQPCRVPVIINVYDAYMARSNTCGITVDVEDEFPGICEMSWCHQSQIAEWLPWVGRHDMKAPASLAEWTLELRRRFMNKNRQLGIASSRALEVFTLTAWGASASEEQLANDFPAQARIGC
jgi:LmbE family N-acetylglucosaminyl deacetylase